MTGRQTAAQFVTATFNGNTQILDQHRHSLKRTVRLALFLLPDFNHGIDLSVNLIDGVNRGGFDFCGRDVALVNQLSEASSIAGGVF